MNKPSDVGMKLVSATLLVASIATSARAQAAPNAPEVIAIENVTVIPMDRERLLEKHTVVVEGRRISAVGPTASTRVPEGATKVDGRGKS